MRATMKGVPIPKRKTKGSCGYDISSPRDIEFHDEWVDVDLGIAMDDGDIPEGCFGLLAVRSSTGSRDGLQLRNALGIIDSSYTMDSMKATLRAPEGVSYRRGDRILQLVIVPYLTIGGEDEPTEERTGGVGSTGVRP